MYVSLLFDFRRELAEADAEIRQARLRDDMPSIRASVHKLKGISGNVGATDLYTQLVELEQCLQGGSAENVDNLLDTLYGYVTTAESVLAAAGQAIAAYPEAPLSIPAAGENLDVRKLQPALCDASCSSGSTTRPRAKPSDPSGVFLVGSAGRKRTKSSTPLIPSISRRPKAAFCTLHSFWIWN
ncbi:MAG: Hpt domain-containing protein [Bilophila wadsworthia]